MTDPNFREVYGVLESYCEMEQSKTGKTKRQNKQKKLRGKYFPRLKTRQRKMEIKHSANLQLQLIGKTYFVHGKGISARQNRLLTGSFSKKWWKRTLFSVKSTCFFGPIQLIKAGSSKISKTRKRVIPT